MARIIGTEGDDRLHGRNNADTMKGLAGNDRLAGRAGDDVISGGDGDDRLIGQQDRDTLNGGAGDDVLRGGTFQEEARGSTPFDTLDGGEGDDKLYGGYDRDTLTGGSGADRFIYRAEDEAIGGDGERITDFEEGVDRLVFRGDLRSGDAPLHFIGSQAFSGVAGEVRFEVGSDTSVVQIDLDGDTDIDMAIGFTGAIQFQQRDFSF